VHFELSADDPDRAARFYEQALGWSVRRWNQSSDAPAYWLCFTGEGPPGIDGGMTQRGPASFPGTTLTIDVDDLEGCTARVRAAGGEVLMAPVDVPGVGRLAYCADTERNVFGLLQSLRAS
jgi:predicted enzyme related to lactoylglutathione lyase